MEKATGLLPSEGGGGGEFLFNTLVTAQVTGDTQVARISLNNLNTELQLRTHWKLQIKRKAVNMSIKGLSWEAQKELEKIGKILIKPKRKKINATRMESSV